MHGWICPQILEGTGSTPELVLCPLAPIHQGHYICRINHGIKCIFSQWAHVSVIHSAGMSCHSSFFPLTSWDVSLLILSPLDCGSSLPAGSASGLLITSQPQSKAVSEGDTLFLECKVQANPPAQYMWHHNMVPMRQEKSRLLQVSSLLNNYNTFILCHWHQPRQRTWNDAFIGLQCHLINTRGCSTSINSYVANYMHILISNRPQICIVKTKFKFLKHFERICFVAALSCLSACVLASSRSPVWQQHKGGSTDARCSICIMKPGLMQQQLPLVRLLHIVYSKINQHQTHIQNWGVIVCKHSLFFLLSRTHFHRWCLLGRNMPTSRYCFLILYKRDSNNKIVLSFSIYFVDDEVTICKQEIQQPTSLTPLAKRFCGEFETREQVTGSVWPDRTFMMLSLHSRSNGQNRSPDWQHELPPSHSAECPHCWRPWVDQPAQTDGLQGGFLARPELAGDAQCRYRVPLAARQGSLRLDYSLSGHSCPTLNDNIITM